MICCLKQKYLQGICVTIKFMNGKNQVPQWIVEISMDMSFNMFFKSNFTLTFDPQIIACLHMHQLTLDIFHCVFYNIKANFIHQLIDCQILT